MTNTIHITEEELRKYYLIQAKKMNQEPFNYVGLRINEFNNWNDEWNKRKFELYIKENLQNMQQEYDDIIKRENDEREKQRRIINELLTMNVETDVKIELLNRYNIPLNLFMNFQQKYILSNNLRMDILDNIYNSIKAYDDSINKNQNQINQIEQRQREQQKQFNKKCDNAQKKIDNLIKNDNAVNEKCKHINNFKEIITYILIQILLISIFIFILIKFKQLI